MVNRAEQIMYKNKQKYYSKVDDIRTKYRPHVLYSLLKDFELNSFRVYLQPKAKLENDYVYGAEALIRRVDLDGRIIMPFEFIKLLEEERLISTIDYFVLKQVCEHLKIWKEEGLKDLIISVNISRITINEIGFVNEVCKICDDAHVSYNQIELEITESAATLDDNRLQEILIELSEKGFSIALDDMGMMYSSFEMLTMRGLQTIKLDSSLIRKLEKDKPTQILASHLITLCHDLGYQCVAEGVETQNQKDIIKRMNCDHIQGRSEERREGKECRL